MGRYCQHVFFPYLYAVTLVDHNSGKEGPIQLGIQPSEMTAIQAGCAFSRLHFPGDVAATWKPCQEVHLSAILGTQVYEFCFQSKGAAYLVDFGNDCDLELLPGQAGPETRKHPLHPDICPVEAWCLYEPFLGTGTVRWQQEGW